MPMSKTEAAALGGRANAAKRLAFKERYLAARAQGECRKRAAYIAGISLRTARRYQTEAR